MDNVVKNIIMIPFNILYKINPKMELKLLFRLKKKRNLNLENPKTYSEKLQWIKLYDKNPLMPKCVDKYLVRNYVKNKGCIELLNELYWSGFNPEEIPFDDLPNKYVIKVTHGSTFNIIVNDSTKIDKKLIIKKLKKWLKSKFLPCYGEWFYGKEKPRIIIEKYLENPDVDQLFDYKVYCFNGVPKFVRFDVDRFSHHKCNLYDVNWQLIEGVTFKYPNINKKFKKPENFEKMLDYAKKLSQDFKHVRVDFYNIEGKIIFGELTFTSGAGFDEISPLQFDEKLGDYLRLDNNDENNFINS